MLFAGESERSVLHSNWGFIEGNKEFYFYYAGVAAGNPSGTTDNVQYIKLKDATDTIVFTKEFYYDVTDRVIQVIGHTGNFTA